MTPPNGTEYGAIVDTHRHPVGPKLRAKMVEAGLFDPNQEFPQTNAQDFICYREFFDLDYAMPKQCGAASPSALPAMAAKWTGSRGNCFKSKRARPSSS